MQNATTGICEGAAFGDLTAVEVIRKGKHGSTHWKCACACGAEVQVTERRLLAGSTKTCGKHPSAAQLANNDRHRKRLQVYPDGYGSGSRLHRIWCNMKSRCQNPNFPKFQAYGARGIGVCDAWQRYGEFLAWALGAGYNEDLTLDRKDNALGYTPENCRWVTTLVQQRNKRAPRKTLTVFGETKTLADWAADSRCKVGYKALAHRVRLGDSPEDCLLPQHKAGRPAGGRACALRRLREGSDAE